MLPGILGAWLALAPNAAAGSGAPSAAVIPFRLDAQPRVDAVFGDAASLRLAVERFFALQTDMERVRDEFSTAVHETLTALAGTAELGAGPRAKTESSVCPSTTAAPYARALAAGTKYLLLGQQLQGRYRDIRRADDLGDAVALTPDYRAKIKKVRELHQRLLDDYREMRIAFYDQLGAEMRHASCKPGKASAAAPIASRGDGAVAAPNPSDPSAWTMDEPAADEPQQPAATVEKTAGPRALTQEVAATGASMAAPSIWIDVDNTLCAQPTRVSVDGQPMGEVGARKKTSIRTHAGPRELCALPASDARSCGDAGTVRKAYLHEGWSLTVHCDK